MNKRILLIILLFSYLCKFSTAQILCIYCYDQNGPISSGVNNYILNGGFENTTCIPNVNTSSFCPNSNNYSCDILNWTCTGGGTNTYASIVDTNAEIIAEGANAAYFGNSMCIVCTATQADTSCLINIDCAVTGVPPGHPYSWSIFGGTSGVGLEQTITGLTIGNTYVLEFWAGGEDGSTLSGLFAVDVGFGDTLLRNKAAHNTGIGTRYIIEFNATASSHTIKFTNWGHICVDCNELILDDVRLYTLAELDASVPNCTVGINDVFTSQNLITVSLNPVANELTVKTKSNELTEIIVYDISSRKLLQQEFMNSISVNTEQFAKGIYLFEVRNKSGVLKKGKVVKD